MPYHKDQSRIIMGILVHYNPMSSLLNGANIYVDGSIFRVKHKELLNNVWSNHPASFVRTPTLSKEGVGRLFKHCIKA